MDPDKARNAKQLATDLYLERSKKWKTFATCPWCGIKFRAASPSAKVTKCDFCGYVAGVTGEMPEGLQKYLEEHAEEQLQSIGVDTEELKQAVTKES